MGVLGGALLIAASCCAGVSAAFIVYLNGERARVRERLGMFGRVAASKNARKNRAARGSMIEELVQWALERLLALPRITPLELFILRYAHRYSDPFSSAFGEARGLSIASWLVACAILCSLLLASWLGAWSIAGGVALGIGPWLALNAGQRRGVRAEREQLIGYVEQLIDQLKAGRSLAQAMHASAAHATAPLATYSDQAVELLTLGYSAPRAFKEAFSSCRVNEAASLGVALEIQAKTGGNLMQLLQEYAQQFRQTLLFEQNLKTQTAQGRLSVKVVAFIPPLLVAVLNFMSPGYFNAFLSTSLGKTLFIIALALDAMGLVMIKKIMFIEEVS